MAGGAEFVHFEGPDHLPGGFLVMKQPFEIQQTINIRILEDEFSDGNQSITFGVTATKPLELSECDIPDDMEEIKVESEEPLINFGYWKFLPSSSVIQKLRSRPLRTNDVIRIIRKDLETIVIRVFRCEGGMKRREKKIEFKLPACPTQNYLLLYTPADPWIFQFMSQIETFELLSSLSNAPPSTAEGPQTGREDQDSPRVPIENTQEESAWDRAERLYNERYGESQGSQPSSSSLHPPPPPQGKTKPSRKKLINLTTASSHKIPTPSGLDQPPRIKAPEKPAKDANQPKEDNVPKEPSKPEKKKHNCFCCPSECPICMDFEILDVVLGCGHWGFCAKCIDQILNKTKPQDRTCPVCRKNIRNVISLYAS